MIRADPKPRISILAPVPGSPDLVTTRRPGNLPPKVVDISLAHQIL